MTSELLHKYPHPTENLYNRAICIYVTDIPKSFSTQDIEYIFNKLSRNYITTSKVEFAPCFYDPYDKKCAYVYFDKWFSASEEITNIECYFILNTFYTYLLPRTWYQYFNNEPRQSLKFFYTREPVHIQGIKENWKMIQEQNIFQEIRRQNVLIRRLRKRICMLEEKIVSEEDDEMKNDDYDMNSYHNII